MQSGAWRQGRTLGPDRKRKAALDSVLSSGLRIGFALAMCLACLAARAEVAETPLTGFVHTAWTAKTGAPGEINALAQTRDGMLWIGTTSGLFHFDGLHFVRFQQKQSGRLPLEFISSLYAPPSGGLWVGLNFGGVVFLKEDSLVEYPPGSGLPDGTVFAITQDRSGMLWAATIAGVKRLEGGQWTSLGPEWGLPPGLVSDLLIDRSGTVWACLTDGFYFLQAGSRRFTKEPLDGAIRPYGKRGIIAESPEGTLWVTDYNRGQRPIRGKQVLASGGSVLLFDHEGALWYSPDDALRRLLNPRAFAQEDAAPLIERIDAQTGLSNATVNALIEDREGNIWAGAQDGINLFARTSVHMVRRQPGVMYFALARARDGTMWWAEDNAPSNQGRIFHFVDGKAVEQLTTTQSFDCAYADEDGTLWLAGAEGAWRLDGKRLQPLPALHVAAHLNTQAMIRSRDGSLWRSVIRKGVFRFAHGEWQLNGGLAGLPNEPAVLMTADIGGRLWFGYTKNRIAIIDGNSVRMLGPADGLNVGNVTAIGTRAGNVWVGGEHGLARLDRTRFVSVQVPGENPYRSVWGVVETAAGELWVASGSALVRLDRTQLAEVLAGRVPSTPPQSFDYHDGIDSAVQALRPLPALMESADGRVWFALANSMGFVDPAHIMRNTLPPPVSILGLRAGEREYSPFSSEIRLPPRTTPLTISYTAASFGAPEDVHFRYRLEGLDEDPQNVGNRREAVYTNLGPGTYRFQVMAASRDGPWSAAPVSLTFTILPAFDQTIWFFAICALAAIAIIALLYRLRIHQVRAAVRSRLEERIMERERIARDLHDTLLQGLQGLILRFHSVAVSIPPHEGAREVMERTLTSAEDVLIESRNRVKELRDSTEMRVDLPAEIAAVGEPLAQEHSMEFAVAVEGTPQRLHPIVREEAFLIGREALLNAFRHSGARNIEVEIRFGATELRLCVRDDGRGVEREVLGDGGRSGHWGLSGMRERAKKIRSQLAIWSRPGAGTEVELRVPGAMAYRNAESDRVRTWRRMLSWLKD